MKRGIAALLLAAGCAAAPERQDFEVGAHRVSVETPEGWHHAAQGDRHVIRGDGLQLVFEDLGPGTRLGLRSEVERLRELWRAGRDREARTEMRRIEVGQAWFKTAEQRSAFMETWYALSGATAGLGLAEAEARFTRLLDAIEELRQPSLNEIADAALLAMGEDQRRAVASRLPRPIARRSGVLVTTWQRLSHEHPRTFAIVIADGRVLTLRAESAWGKSDPRAFEQVLESMRMPRTTS